MMEYFMVVVYDEKVFWNELVSSSEI